MLVRSLSVFNDHASFPNILHKSKNVPSNQILWFVQTQLCQPEMYQHVSLSFFLFLCDFNIDMLAKWEHVQKKNKNILHTRLHEINTDSTMT